MVDHLNLKIDPVTPVGDHGQSGSAIGNRPSGKGVSLGGLLSIPKFLADKKSKAREEAKTRLLQKKRLTLNFYRQDNNGTKHNVKARIALQVDEA